MMIRKLLTATAVVFALLFGVMAQDADAQQRCHVDDVKCAAAVPYAGGFDNHPKAPNTGGNFAAVAPSTAAPAPAAGTGGGDSSAPLAVTGTETRVLTYFGTGLIAFGAAAAGTRRRLFKDALV